MGEYDNDIFNRFNDLLGDDTLIEAFKPEPRGLNRFDPNDDDCETVFTSKELYQMKQAAEKTDDDKKLPPVTTGSIIEESVHFKSYAKKRVHKYTEKEMNEIREGCKDVIVHDYTERDIYHVSDEERFKDDSLKELRVQLATLHKLYNKVDEWVKAMRIVMKAWAIVEEKDNFLHSKDEFYELIAEDRIYHNAIIMPRLKGMSKYNLDVLIQYISNPELDPSDLLTEAQKRRMNMYNSFYEDEEEDNEETDEERMERLLDPDDVLMLTNENREPEKPMTIAMAPISDIKGYDSRLLSQKKLKKLPKRKRIKEYSKRNLHIMLNKIQSDPSNRQSNIFGYGFSSLITKSMFEPQKKDDFIDKMRFKGSWASDTDNYVYDLQMREALLEQPIPGLGYKTYGDEELNSFFNDMESVGLNALELRRKMNMTPEQNVDRTVQRTKKQTKKLESAIIQRITKLNGDPKFKKTIEKAEKAIARESY